MACAPAVFEFKLVVSFAQEAICHHLLWRRIHSGTGEIVHDVQGDLAESVSSMKVLVSAAPSVHAVLLYAV